MRARWGRAGNRTLARRFTACCAATTLALPLALTILAGCATAIPEPVVTQTVEVRVPVPVLCKVSLPERPVYELDRTHKDADIWTLARAAVVELRQRQAYQALIEAAARSCSE